MFRHLFVPVDGSELSERAMRTAIGLAAKLGAQVTAFIAEPDTPLPQIGMELRRYERDTEAHIERTDTHARTLLTRYEVMAGESGVPFSGVHDRDNGIDQAIVEQAERAGADLIVMGTHTRGRLGELLHGSHTKAVISATRIPLLAVH
ncbi:MAG: hypothetical protein RLY78_4027 [Pseudomonadota bacterium]|jgi:nucleotide-binding universal stress UspA family protein|uniref:Universal stress protein n=1 Tax=Pseudaquabacterium rugosum TaxID=2984194 RepID=A0ABU9B448_9BURK